MSTSGFPCTLVSLDHPSHHLLCEDIFAKTLIANCCAGVHTLVAALSAASKPIYSLVKSNALFNLLSLSLA